ncbi:MAG: class II fructose-bisphosphate aldolase [Planctomycetota bacterium]|nr:class II fructose-bisphosphate aldolase [Planctomycetota bacterium]
MVYEPISGKIMFDALRDKGCIILAANTRITEGILRGLFRAAKDTDSPLIVELAKSECNQHIGYTGYRPSEFAKVVYKCAADVGWDIWALHADHTTVKKGDPEEIKDTKELLAEQIDSGYTSFAIDASYLFNFEGKDEYEQLKPNIEVTAEIAHFIAERMGSHDFGLEVEVGEIGKKDSSGMVLTTPEEAVVFIKGLKEKGVEPQVIAVANGSVHGNIYDKDGNPIPQETIDIDRTKAIAAALRRAGYRVRIAQHGITGTPLPLIAEKFPKGDIIKGNVGTLWQNIAWEIFSIYEPVLYKRIYDWTLEKYGKPGKKREQVFGTDSKNAIKVFFKEIYAMGNSTRNALEAVAYAEALKFFRAFSSEGTASIVRNSIKKR